MDGMEVMVASAGSYIGYPIYTPFWFLHPC